MNKKAVSIVAGVICLALAGLIILIANNQSVDQPHDLGSSTLSSRANTKNYDYIRDLDQDLIVDLPSNSDPDNNGRFDVSFKQLACQSTLQYLGRDDLASTKQDLVEYANTFKAARQDILTNANLPATSALIYEDDLSQDILNQGSDIYANFRLLANYSHYTDQQSALAVLNSDDLDFITRAQVIGYAMNFIASAVDQPRPDLAYGLSARDSARNYFLNSAVTVEEIQQDVDKYRICDLDYIYTNVSGQGLSSHDFSDICRSGSLARPVEFSFVTPLIVESVAYIDETINHPNSWPIGYDSTTEDCGGSYIERNQTHVRVVKFLMPADTNFDGLIIEIANQIITLNTQADD